MARVKPPYGLPTKLKICGFSFDVEYYDNMQETIITSTYLNQASVADNTQVIKVAYVPGIDGGTRAQPYEKLVSSIVHELIHIFALKYRIDSISWNDDNCEDNTNRLANAITDFVFSNGYLKRGK